MTAKLPVCIYSGLLGQLQAGDTLAVNTPPQFVAVASSLLAAGAPVYVPTTNAVDNADARVTAFAVVVGMSIARTLATAPATIQTAGTLTLTTVEWDAIAGTVGGLVGGTAYYLGDMAAGTMMAPAPSTPTEWVVPLGVALNTTDFLISIGSRVQL